MLPNAVPLRGIPCSLTGTFGGQDVLRDGYPLTAVSRGSAFYRHFAERGFGFFLLSNIVHASHALHPSNGDDNARRLPVAVMESQI